ncbi:hypothetical protein LCGC14_2698690 [marine sediment metagenome]|uniref:Uncharacterized protein n=1 Tax=marine sediment metagenome TaxID=412755 RepID=A0A0F8ZGE0_9ZZZZ
MTSTILTGPEMQKQIWTRLREYALGTEYGRLDGKCARFMIHGGREWKVFVNLSDQFRPSSIRTNFGFMLVPPGTLLAQSGGALSAKREAVIIRIDPTAPTSIYDLDVMAKLLEDLERACNKKRVKAGT